MSATPFPVVAPRFLAYCIAHGNTPDEQLAKDKARYRSEVMGYVYWTRAEIALWCKEAGTTPLEVLWKEQCEFTTWLVAKYPQPKPQSFQRCAAR